MSNTQKRVFSAIIIMLIVTFCLYKGRFATLNFTLIAGILSIDEICRNLLSHKRTSWSYILNQVVFVTSFIFICYLENVPAYYQVGTNAAVFLNLLLLYFLFQKRERSKSFFERLKKSILFQMIPAVFILFPMIALSSIFSYENWVVWLFTFMCVNFGMDTGAWFFGRKYGKKKLWEAVSPKKTIEGTIGGVITGSLLGYIYLSTSFSILPPFYLIIVFGLIAASSQLGDLVQSKLKRIADIKDSSGLIPGHGGVYDRLDSLLFSAPIFSITLPWLTSHFS